METICYSKNYLEIMIPKEKLQLFDTQLHHPESLSYPYEREARLGNINMKVVAWGQQNALDPENSGGFRQGFQFSPETDVTSDLVQEFHAYTAAHLVQEALHKKDWKGADIIIIGSTTSRPEITQYVPNARFVNYACNLFPGSIGDIYRNPDYKNQNLKVVIVGVESIVGAPNEKKTSKIFGNGAGWMAFETNDFEHLDGETVVSQDTMNVIQVPKMYEWPPSGERLPILDGYSFVNGSEAVYCRTHDGNFVSIPESPDKFFHMKDRTAVSFLRMMPPIVTRAIRKYRQEFQPVLGMPLQEPMCHQPSQRVTEAVEEDVYRLDMIADGIDPKEAARISILDANQRLSALEQIGKPELGYSVPFVLRETNNMSAPTFVAMGIEMVHQGRIVPNKPMLLIGYGACHIGTVETVIPRFK